MENWEPKPPGTLWATPVLLQDSFTFMCFLLIDIYEILFTSWTNDVWQFGVGVTVASQQQWHWLGNKTSSTAVFP
jgi:hypothetical protein